MRRKGEEKKNQLAEASLLIGAKPNCEWRWAHGLVMSGRAKRVNVLIVLLPEVLTAGSRCRERGER